MLQVSQLLKVARGDQSAASMKARRPERFETATRRAPVVVWNVCRHCNMTCPHCYAAACNVPSPHDMPKERALEVIDEMAACGVRILIFSGGEPLLRSDLFELIAHAREKGLLCQLSSNGSLIDEAMAARLAEAKVMYVGVSIDGRQEFNDDYRGLENGYELAVAALKHSKAAGMRTGLRTTLTALNSSHLDDMLSLATDVGVSRFYVSHLVHSGRGRKMASKDLSSEQSRNILLSLFERAERILDDEAAPQIVTGSNDSDGVLLLHWVAERYGKEPAARVLDLLMARGGNSAGEGIVAIDHRGRVHPDQFWQEETLADLRSESFEAMFEHPLRQQLENRSSLLTGRCGECVHVALCRGSHRERAVASGAGMWSPDPACVLTEEEVGTALVTADTLTNDSPDSVKDLPCAS